MLNLRNVDVIHHYLNVNGVNEEIIYKYCVKKLFLKVLMC